MIRQRRLRRCVLVALLHSLALLGCVPVPALVAGMSSSTQPGSAPVLALGLPGACGVAVTVAVQQMGKPYVWGAKGPDAFDCSGLTHYAYKAAGVEIGYGTDAQARTGVPIPCTVADLRGSQTTCWQVGDLIFLRYPAGQHVSIYVQDGMFADCYNEGTGCIYHDVSKDPTYQRYFWQARRISHCAPAVASGAGALGAKETP